MDDFCSSSTKLAKLDAPSQFYIIIISFFFKALQRTKTSFNNFIKYINFCPVSNSHVRPFICPAVRLHNRVVSVTNIRKNENITHKFAKENDPNRSKHKHATKTVSAFAFRAFCFVLIRYNPYTIYDFHFYFENRKSLQCAPNIVREYENLFLFQFWKITVMGTKNPIAPVYNFLLAFIFYFIYLILNFDL